MSKRNPTSTAPADGPALNQLWQRQLRLLRLLLILYAVIFLLVGSTLIIALIGHEGDLFLVAVFELCLITILLVLYVIAYRLQAGYHRRQDQRRTLAMQGDPMLLAAEQPIPNADALSLPTTIRLRLKRRSYVVIYIIAAIILFLAAMVFIFFTQLFDGVPFGRHAGSVGRLLVVMGVPSLIYVIGMLVGLVFIARRNRQSLEVTAGGLSGLFLGKVSRVNWADAKLFSITGVRKNRRPVLYELSDGRETVRWTRPAAQGTWLVNAIEPTNDFADYQRQMDALLSLIAAKTGLPLYDLREPGRKWYY